MMAKKNMTASDALEAIDAQWYRGVNKGGRWMDLIGDYAGTERFIVDGESLLQQVLDDPLLALGRDDEPSFQILHALHSMERFLNDMLKRSAVFDIVFWHENRHLTLEGDSAFVVTSRALARTLLFNHLLRHTAVMGIDVHTFDRLSDEAWKEYQQRTRPMFVMLNDGGAPSGNSETDARPRLSQREFIFNLLSQGIAVSLLMGAELRDSKIFSFIFEQRFSSDARSRFSMDIWLAVSAARASLDSDAGLLDRQATRLHTAPLPPDRADLNSIFQELVRISKSKIAFAPDFDADLFWELLYVYLLHLLLLPALSLQERASTFEPFDSDRLNEILMDSFLPHVFRELQASLVESNTFVDNDGRVFMSLLRFLVMHTKTPVSNTVGPELLAQADAVWSAAGAPHANLSKLATFFPNGITSAEPPEDTTDEYTLVPFHNEVFDSELASVHVTVSDADTPVSGTLEFSAGTFFTDSNHWHNHRQAILPKHMGGQDPKPLVTKLRLRQLRSEQRFMSSMQQLAATLTGASGTSLSQMLIPRTGKLVEQLLLVGSESTLERSSGRRGGANQQQQKQQKQPNKKGKLAPISSADKIRQQHLDDKKAKEDVSSQEWWEGQLAQMASMTNAQKANYLLSLFRNSRSYSVGWLSVEMRLYKVHLELLHWIAESVPEDGATRDRYTVSILREVKQLYEGVAVTPTTLGHLASIITSLGFDTYLKPLEDAAASRAAPDRPMSFKFVKLLKSKTKRPVHAFMHIAENPIVWQLRLFGEFMDRSMDSQPDARVSFQPDAWQREVLDCLDHPKCSVLVVAPTSAGKTFISFYAMEKVLKESDDGIIVYVAPTKALVNQVAAEVYARFNKNVDGRTCWAIHTRDFRVHDPQKCQILVTVPEMLAIMLLSPPLARTWTPRIRRIILDEIHTIGQQEGGAVWEQIILMAPCPIIGLSATVGEPEAFNTWLQSVQTAKGFEHRFVHHPHRYSHLRKFSYSPQLLPAEERFHGLDQPQADSQMMRFIHPISSLAFGATSLPSDLSLEATDLLRLYEALLSTGTDVDISHLNPVVFFSSTSFIRQQDLLRYEASLKESLTLLLTKFDILAPKSPLKAVLCHAQIQDQVIARIDEKILNTPPEPDVFMSGLIHLLTELNANGNLPALLFDFDRHECELMGKRLVKDLQDAEKLWRNSSKEWTRKINAWEDWKSRQKDRDRLAEKLRAQKKDADSEHAMRAEDSSWESSFDPNDPSLQFSFAGTSSAYPASELHEDIRKLKWTSTPSWVFDALSRGIGIHHSGMNKHYRSLVERLFRVGFLRVVIATGTLALGINAPAKTTVFCGDSPFLTALTYRQCAGRAGRRGFDLLGRVVFYGLPMDRIYRLMLSRLPRLSGTFPLSSTLVLRLFDLLHGSQYAPYAVKAIQSILQLPHISFGSEVGKSQVLHHLRFSIEYLRRANLLDSEGRPVNLFGIASHIYYTEPSNLALVTLLQSGVIHEICGQAIAQNAQQELMILLCHLFGRRYLPKVYATAVNIREIIKKGPSRVVLPPMYGRAREVLVTQQEQTMRIFTSYALEFASQHAASLGPNNCLPLSGATFGASNGPGASSELHSYLHSTSVHPVARSPFVANSGHADDFEDVAELANGARSGIHLNGHAIPSFERITALREDAHEPKALNAHLYDFYMHGQVTALVNMNGIKRGDVWYALQDFHMTLTTIRGGVYQLLLQQSKNAAEKDESEFDLDSGYATFDPAEQDMSTGVDETSSAVTRPVGVSDRDWKVYEVLDAITEEFGRKFKAMWA